MSEEIKFRAWDRRRKKMHMVGAIVWDNGKIVEVDADNGDLIKRYELMQFTGLTDSKRIENYPEGQEIYEGDILPIWEHGEKYYYKVIYDGDCFMLAILDSDQGSYPLATKNYRSEVIGNIHDNPELLGAGA